MLPCTDYLSFNKGCNKEFILFYIFYFVFLFLNLLLIKRGKIFIPFFLLSIFLVILFERNGYRNFRRDDEMCKNARVISTRENNLII